MKRIAMMTAALCLVATLQFMGQTTPTTNSASKTKAPARPASNHPMNTTSTSAPKGQVPAKTWYTTDPSRKGTTEQDGERYWYSTGAATKATAAEQAREGYWYNTGTTTKRTGIVQGPESTRSSATSTIGNTAAAPAPEGTTSSTGASTTTAQTPEGTTNPTPQAPPTWQASASSLKCLGPERRPCTRELVQDLARRTGEKSTEHPALAEIKALALDAPDGTLSCRQGDGGSCTREQVKALNEHVAASLRYNVIFEYSK
jgi:hypothetical protein